MAGFFTRFFSPLLKSAKKPTPKAEIKEVREEKIIIPPKKVIHEQESLADTGVRAREIIQDAREEAFKTRKAAEDESRRVRTEALQVEQRLAQKEENIDRKLSAMDEREKQLEVKKAELEKKLAEVEQNRTELLSKLERAAGLTREEAKNLILKTTETHLEQEIARKIREAEAEIKDSVDVKAREILADAMFHGVTDYVSEFTTTTVKLPDDEMKGRIIGREGRNIKAFETATNVDVDIDETPGVIRLSSFDPVRREVAKVSLERLIADGRIQPVKIEEIVAKTQKDIARIIHEEGEKLCHTVGVFNLPADKVDLLGRFKYRFSYGQNMIVHTLEETKIGIALANEIGADVNVVRLACLLHDIGKVITDEEGTHVELGVDLLKRNHMPQKVINAVAEHHEDKPFSSIESIVVYIADAISGARPGARRENVEDYIKRLSDLENIANSFTGVEKSFAIQAGRELRVIVIPDQVDDNKATKLSHDIAEKIQKELTYPGQVKVTVIRETRSVDIAK